MQYLANISHIFCMYSLRHVPESQHSLQAGDKKGHLLEYIIPNVTGEALLEFLCVVFLTLTSHIVFVDHF